MTVKASPVERAGPSPLKIGVYDDFLTKEELDYTIAYTNDKEWAIQKSDYTGRLGAEFLQLHVEHEEYFNTHIFNRIKEKIDGDLNVSEIYFNGQWPGRDGSFHTDNVTLTVLIYIQSYVPEWGGFIQFMDSDDPRSQIILPPFQNRMVMFPGDLLHKPYAFAHQVCPMRISLAYKLE